MLAKDFKTQFIQSEEGLQFQVSVEDFTTTDITPEQRNILLCGPDHEHYLEVSMEIESAQWTKEGKNYSLLFDNDIYMIGEDQ